MTFLPDPADPTSPCPTGPAARSSAPVPTPAEMAEAQRWAARFDGSGAAEPCFSFGYGGKPASELLAGWERACASRSLDPQRTEHTILWTDPETGLAVRCVAVAYSDYPVVEWTAYLQNTGRQNTPLIENLQALDVVLAASGPGDFVLHGNRGDHNVADSYAPYEMTLWQNTDSVFAPTGGRACDKAFPYFNLAKPDGGGIILAVGWPGQWSARFTHRAGPGLQVTAGQELTRLYLEPGERIRTPLMALLLWEGSDVVRAQNLWRRWLLAHNLPRPQGQPLRPALCFCDYAFFGWARNTEAGEKLFIDELTRQGIQLDYWWMDAGWFPRGQGEWVVDRERFPNGLKALSDYVHARNMQLMAWFEPESAYPWSLTAQANPQAMLDAAVPEPMGLQLLYLGDEQARRWVTDHVDGLLRAEGIDLYRQDMNLSPLGYWRDNDRPNRLGLHENLHVQGYLAFWDELRRRHPGMLIDSCAGGGRRNDLETLRRGVPFLRSDYQHFGGHPQWAIGNQGHTYGIASWIPYFGQGVYWNAQQFVYSVRSYLSPAFSIICDVRNPDLDWDLYRRLVDQWRRVAPCFLGDYYPLTPYSLDERCPLAWQFDRPECGDGMVQVFRRRQVTSDSLPVRLCGLESDTAYSFTDLDSTVSRQATGRQALEQGLQVTVPECPGAAILYYCRLG